jgi:hypothetical protein
VDNLLWHLIAECRALGSGKRQTLLEIGQSQLGNIGPRKYG